VASLPRALRASVTSTDSAALKLIPSSDATSRTAALMWGLKRTVVGRSAMTLIVDCIHMMVL
jgi:hypothetical protein